MRMNFAFGFFLVLFLFSPTKAASANIKQDSLKGSHKKLLQNPESNFHFSFTYGRAIFSTRTGVVNAYLESGYPYHVISRADPSARTGQPLVLSATIEKNINKQIILGLQYSKVLKQKITGSNWIGAIQNEDPIPVEQFDIRESYSCNFINGTVNYVLVPVNFVDSRLEVTLGTGVSFNMLKLSGIQYYERHPNSYSAFDDTAAAYHFRKKGFGYLFCGNVDFYWSRNISNQFRLEYRISPRLNVPSQTYTYVTTRSHVRMTDTRTLKKHSIRYSGVILSLSFRFHI